jgi:hypothetical protein
MTKTSMKRTDKQRSAAQPTNKIATRALREPSKVARKDDGLRSTNRTAAATTDVTVEKAAATKAVTKEIAAATVEVPIEKSTAHADAVTTTAASSDNDTLDPRMNTSVTVDMVSVGDGHRAGDAEQQRSHIEMIGDPVGEPVNGETLLNELTATLRRHVVMEDGAAEVAALWAMHTHALDAFSISPRLAITSPVMRCGKTTLLDVLSVLVPNPTATVNTTAAALFHLIDTMTQPPTLLIDEADTFISKNVDLRGILNSGYRRNTARVLRADVSYSTWAPAAIAMIGCLPSTLEDRSILVRLERRRADEVIVPFRHDQTPGLDRLAGMAARWAADNLERLKAADPKVPNVFENREADNWRPMLAIADIAGGEWPMRARQIAESLTVLNRGSEQSAGVMVLDDIFTIFTNRSAESLTSEQLVTALAQMETRPWSEWIGATPITKTALAGLLAPFRIAPIEMRIGPKVLRGYRIEQFDDAFARYVGAAAKQNATALQSVTPTSGT